MNHNKADMVKPLLSIQEEGVLRISLRINVFLGTLDGAVVLVFQQGGDFLVIQFGKFALGFGFA